MKKSVKYVLIAIGVLIVIAIVGQALGIVKPKSKEPEVPATQNTATVTEPPSTEPTETPAQEEPAEESKDSRISYGEVLDQTENTVDGKTVCVLKVKIEPSLTKTMTVDQNYHNVVKFITEGGGDKYDSIDYWAVADMQDGSESKAVSFTVPKETIEKVKDGSLVAIQLKDQVDDLYILPSLQK